MIFAALVASKAVFAVPQPSRLIFIMRSTWHSRNRSVFCYFLTFKIFFKKSSNHKIVNLTLLWRVCPDTEKISWIDGASPKTAVKKQKKTSDFCHMTTCSIILNKELQVNLFQKLLFLHQLTHNMTTDCSLN